MSMRSSTPTALKWAYGAAVVASILLVSSAVSLFTDDSHGTEILFIHSHRALGVINTIGGLVVAALASQFTQAGPISRGVYCAVAVILVLCNLIAAATSVTQVVALGIVGALTLSTIMYMRPSVTGFISTRSKF